MHDLHTGTIREQYSPAKLVNNNNALVPTVTARWRYLFFVTSTQAPSRASSLNCLVSSGEICSLSIDSQTQQSYVIKFVGNNVLSFS